MNRALFFILLMVIHCPTIGSNQLQTILIKKDSNLPWQKYQTTKQQQKKISKYLKVDLIPLNTKIFWPQTMVTKNLQPTLNRIYEITNTNIIAGRIKKNKLEWNGIINGIEFHWESKYSNLNNALFESAEKASHHISNTHFVRIKIRHNKQNFSYIMNKLNKLCRESYWQVINTNERYIYLEGNTEDNKCYIKIGEKVV